MAIAEVPQQAFDEQVIEDPGVENALELREKRRNQLAAVRAEYKIVDDSAKAEIAKLELPDGGAARVGRFRVTRRTIPGKTVTFDTEARTRISISIADKDA